MKHLLTLIITFLSMTAVYAASIENELLTVKLTGQDLSIISKQTGAASVPRSNLAYQISASAVEANTLRLTHDNGWVTTLSLPPGSPFLLVDVLINNSGDQPAFYGRVDLLKLTADCGAPLATLRALGSGGLTTIEQAEGSYSYSLIADPVTRKGVVCAFLTQEQGNGLCFPQVVGGKPQMSARIEFGRLRVLPGATRRTETLLVGCFNDGRIGLETFADAVAAKYKIVLPPRPHVHCTRYVNHASNENEIAQNTTFAEEHLKPFGLSVMQIDDGWQAKVPEGATYADTFENNGPVKCFFSTKSNYLTAPRRVAGGGSVPKRKFYQ